MAKIVWVTDIHLNFLDDSGIGDFIRKLQREKADALFITGDIAEAPTVCSYLKRLEQSLDTEIYFVLGNHDFYNGFMDKVLDGVVNLSGNSSSLNFLDISPPVKIGNTGLVGHGGWADGRFGDFFGSQVWLNDYELIGDFRRLTKDEIFDKLNGFGDAAALVLREKLENAFLECDNVLCLTHVPPFRESCWHRGEISNDDYLPHFSCKVMGEMMMEVMESRPESNLTVLCGHTHSPGRAQIRDNLLVIAGGAEYGRPEIQDVFYCTNAEKAQPRGAEMNRHRQ
ncbi:MAG: metallophosphoesterase [Candidatus Thermoplasmatota archaeon]|nr:metallophosphoesterase [Candidatus Thermoplasmatota archaeon]MBU4144705.1 metallophosphoesterase [Candidatus Thermoplasmatota archaeon]MBU4592684.1 metallophosphoesterase [Candidatus Thermoplasmatota archaeon]